MARSQLHLSCPPEDWRLNSYVTLECSVPKGDLHSACPDAVDFVVNIYSYPRYPEDCPVTNFTNSCAVHNAGCSSSSSCAHNSTHYVMRRNIFVDFAVKDGWNWRCFVGCLVKDAKARGGGKMPYSSSNCERVCDWRSCRRRPTTSISEGNVSTRVHLACPADHWRENANVTLECSVPRADFPSKCTGVTADHLLALIGTIGHNDPCYLLNFTTSCSPSPDGCSSSSRCAHNSTHYVVQRTFPIADAPDSLSWGCWMQCVKKGGADAFAVPFCDCDSESCQLRHGGYPPETVMKPTSPRRPTFTPSPPARTAPTLEEPCEDLELFNQVTCSTLIGSQSKLCSDVNVRDACCASCRGVTTEGPAPCVDLSLKYTTCVTLITNYPETCYYALPRAACCHSCSKVHTSISGCEYGDQNPVICGGARTNPSAAVCSSLQDDCCRSCASASLVTGHPRLNVPLTVGAAALLYLL